MARSRSSHSRWCRVALFWSLASVLSLALFKLALHDSSSSSRRSPPSASRLASPSDLRARLYDRLARDLKANGASFIDKGKTSQSLLLSDIFELKEGTISPKLKPVDPPVRANVLYFHAESVRPISQTIKDVFLPYFDKAIWFQNASLYHASLFHASHQVSPVNASNDEVEAEANAIKSVMNSCCPLRLMLDRVVLTSTGVLLGCWQVISGTDPFIIRTKLKEALPHAPQKQFYDPVILHTTLARLLDQPTIISKEQPTDLIKFLSDLVTNVNSRLRGFQTVVSELWFVEELDTLALALDGRMRVHRFHLGCSGN